MNMKRLAAVSSEIKEGRPKETVVHISRRQRCYTYFKNQRIIRIIDDVAIKIRNSLLHQPNRQRHNSAKVWEKRAKQH